MTQVHRTSAINTGSYTLNLLKKVRHGYDCIQKYKTPRNKSFTESGALEFTGVKRAAFFNRLNRFNDK